MARNTDMRVEHIPSSQSFWQSRQKIHSVDLPTITHEKCSQKGSSPTLHGKINFQANQTLFIGRHILKVAKTLSKLQIETQRGLKKPVTMDAV